MVGIVFMKGTRLPCFGVKPQNSHSPWRCQKMLQRCPALHSTHQTLLQLCWEITGISVEGSQNPRTVWKKPSKVIQSNHHHSQHQPRSPMPHPHSQGCCLHPCTLSQSLATPATKKYSLDCTGSIHNFPGLHKLYL